MTSENSDFGPSALRVKYALWHPIVVEQMKPLNGYLVNCGLDKSLRRLVSIRAAQINECGHTLSFQVKNAKSAGDSDYKISMIAAWRDASCFSQKEKAALEWAEALTRLDQGHVSDEVYHRVAKHFSPKELADLSIAIASSSFYNILHVAFRTSADQTELPSN